MEHIRAVAVAVLRRRMMVPVFVAVVDRRPSRKHIKNTVQKRRPQIFVGAAHGRHVGAVVFRVMLKMGEEPEKMERDVRIFLEDRSEKFASAAAHDFAKLVIRRLVGAAGELPELAVILGVDLYPLEPTLPGDPCDSSHRLGNPRPFGIVCPVDTALVRRGERTQKRMAHGAMLRQLAQMRNLRRKRLLRPRRIVHKVVVVAAHALAVYDGARSEIDADAVERSFVESVGVTQENFGTVAVELPCESYVFRTGLFSTLNTQGASDQEQHQTFHKPPHYHPMNGTESFL